MSSLDAPVAHLATELPDLKAKPALGEVMGAQRDSLSESEILRAEATVELPQYLSVTLAQRVVQDVDSDLLEYALPQELALFRLQQLDAAGKLDLARHLPHGAAAALQLAFDDTLPSLTPLELARAWILRSLALSQPLREDVAAGSVGSVFRVSRQASAGSGTGPQVPVLKVPANTQLSDAVRMLVSEAKSEGDGMDLRFHGTSWDGAFRVATGIDVHRSQSDPRTGLDFGWGFYLAGKAEFASRWAQAVHGTHYAVVVYRDCRRSTGEDCGLTLNGDLWKQVVALGAQKKYKPLQELLKPHVAAGVAKHAWLDSHILHNRTGVLKKGEEPLYKLEQGVQLCIRDDDHAKRWDNHLLGVLVFNAAGASHTARPAGETGAGARGAGAGAGAGACSGATDLYVQQLASSTHA